MLELEALLAHCSEINQRLLRRELLELMRSAEQGQLTFGTAAEGAVGQMEVAPMILELRLTSRPGDEGVDQIVRLYFSEPEELRRCLLAVKLAAKRPGPLGLEEQNGHALEAAARLHRFFTPLP